MNKVFFGDCLQSLRALPEKIVHTCVTSPPYFGLRDYGTAKWEGGDPCCDHGVQRWEGDKQTQGAQSGHAAKNDRLDKRECECGARRVDEQIGLEQTPDEYVAKLVEVFREVRRVLRDDGTCWVNLGDSYNTSGGVNNNGKNDSLGKNKRPSHLGRINGLKPKDLIGIPWRVALALQADGWYLRQDIIWAKPNPVPESVTDRCTKSHEYIFLLSKSERYYFDHEAIKEPAQNWGTRDRSMFRGGTEDPLLKQYGLKGKPDEENPTRNKRSVWNVATKSYKGAHFATFPPDLITPCVLAGAPPEGVVLDPFMGSGTTAMVALTHGRRYIGCELNQAYEPLQEERICKVFADMI